MYIQKMEELGSLRNSSHDRSQLKRKIAPKALQEQARRVVDEVSQYGGIIRQRLDIERMKQPLQKGVFYVAENDGNAEPGFLVFLPKQAPVFLQTKKHAQPPCTLRMRVSPELSSNGSTVLIATFDTIQRTLRIEDVWMWKGASLFDFEPYSKRRTYLKEFVEKCWIPDTRLLGGVTTTILNPKSVDEAFSSDFAGVHTIDLIPEMAGKRRMWIECNPSATEKKRVYQPTHEQKPVEPAPQPVQKNTYVDEFSARAVPVDKMPDIYDLFDADGTIVGRGSVQSFSLAQVLRSNDEVWVDVRWNKEFNGYEIFRKSTV